MTAKRIQNVISESRSALPVTAAYAVVMCLLFGMKEMALWRQTIVLCVSAALMALLNNANALIRIYSRMVSCSYIVMTVMVVMMAIPLSGSIIQLCLIGFYILFFRAYQDKNATGTIYYAFLLLSIASTLFTQTLFLVPVMLFFLYNNIMAGSVRTFSAALLGAATPYWFIAGYCAYTGDFDFFPEHFGELLRLEGLTFCATLSYKQITTFAFLVLLSITGIVHFFRNNFKDKIRTRMLFEIFTIMDIIVIAWIAVQPQSYYDLIGMVIVNTSVLIGHFIALTRTRVTNIAFCLMVIAALALTFFNIWTV